MVDCGAFEGSVAFALYVLHKILGPVFVEVCLSSENVDGVIHAETFIQELGCYPDSHLMAFSLVQRKGESRFYARSYRVSFEGVRMLPFPSDLLPSLFPLQFFTNIADEACIKTILTIDL